MKNELFVAVFLLMASNPSFAQVSSRPLDTDPPPLPAAYRAVAPAALLGPALAPPAALAPALEEMSGQQQSDAIVAEFMTAPKPRQAPEPPAGNYADNLDWVVVAPAQPPPESGVRSQESGVRS